MRDAAPLSILIVDDSRDTAESTAELLEIAGYEVRVALSGEEGLQLAAEGPPDVVLLDIRMPGLDGYEVARRLIADGGSKPPLLVAVTGCGTQMDHEETTRAGFHLHLVKPVDPAVFIGLLKRIERAIVPEARSDPCINSMNNNGSTTCNALVIVQPAFT